MRYPMACFLLVSGAFCCVSRAQLSMKRVSEPAGKTLEKALRESTLGQAGAKPFHVRLEVSQAAGKPEILLRRLKRLGLHRTAGLGRCRRMACRS